MSDTVNGAALAARMVHTLPGWGLWANDLRDFETPYGRVGFRQASVLWVLRHHLLPESQQTPTGIARYFGVQNSAITRAVDKLEQGGYVQRRISKIDRRVHYLIATKRGTDVSEWIERLYTAPLQQELEQLDGSTLESLRLHVEMLNSMLNRIREKAQSGIHLAPSLVEV